jgi:hypothetical protein
MPQIGLNLTMTEEVTPVASRVEEGFRNISDAAGDMKDALQLGDLEQKYKSFADRVDKFHDTQNKMRNQERKEDEKDSRKKSQGERPLKEAAHGVHEVGRVATDLGEGDVMAATGDILSSTSKMVEKLPKVVGEILLVGGATAIALNAVEMQYEKHLKGLAELTSSMSSFGRNFGGTMNMISNTASKYGYTLEEGMSVYRKLAEIGGASLTSKGERRELEKSALNVEMYGRAYGKSPSELARFEAMGMRFGWAENMLGLGGAVTKASGLKEGQFMEALEGLADIIQAGVARGVEVGADEAAQSLAWLSQAGPMFKGQYGVEQYKKMEGVAIGAAKLGREEDVIMWRAAQSLEQDEMRKKGEAGTASRSQITKRLQRGMTPELFGKYREMLTGLIGDKDLIQQTMEEYFGWTAETSERMMKVPTDKFGREEMKALSIKSKKDVEEKARGIMGTPEMSMLRTQETIMNDVRKIAETIVPLKNDLSKGAYDVMQKGVAYSLKVDRYVGKGGFENWKKDMGEGLNQAKENILGPPEMTPEEKSKMKIPPFDVLATSPLVDAINRNTEELRRKNNSKTVIKVPRTKK